MGETDWSAWVGRTRYVEVVLSPDQAERVAATLNYAALATGSPLPPLWHWAYFQDIALSEELAEDGHAVRGGFLPPVDLPNRMWAGSRVTFYRPLLVGDSAACTSTIDNVVAKRGRSGPLVFVTVRHDYDVRGELAIREEQDIVYRERSHDAMPADDAPPVSEWTRTVHPSPVLLFRYSAVTFNAHRIHYDYPYVTDSEGYLGLLVHGPLIATLMCDAFVCGHPHARLRRFSFRGGRPLFAPHAFDVSGRVSEPGRAEVWAADAAGLASRGEIEFE